MTITLNQVKKVAKLAKLSLPEEEEKLLAEQLSGIVSFVEQINTLDTQNIQPTFNVSKSIISTHSEEVNTTITQEQALQNSSQQKNGFFVTKGVFVDE